MLVIVFLIFLLVSIIKCEITEGAQSNVKTYNRIKSETRLHDK